MCCTHTELTHICLFCHLSCLYSCTVSSEMHHSKGPDIWYPKKRTIQQHWEVSCCMALWQFPDSSCNGLTGISATLTLKRVKGSFARSLTRISLQTQYCRAGCSDYDLCLMIMLNVMFSGWCLKCWSGSGSNELFQGDWINHAEGWTQRKIQQNCPLRAQAPSCLTFSSFLDYL